MEKKMETTIMGYIVTRLYSGDPFLSNSNSVFSVVSAKQ